MEAIVLCLFFWALKREKVHDIRRSLTYIVQTYTSNAIMAALTKKEKKRDRKRGRGEQRSEDR
jgi:nitrogen fixation-related uncharacterized protein